MASDLYYFTYSYNGDSSKYYGYGYVNSGTYYAGETLNPYAANNQSKADGTYYISSVSKNSGSDSDVGKVYTQSYYDSQSNNSYTPYYRNLGSADGSNNLGSEIDYINQNGTYKGFGADFFEANSNGADRYEFTYSYKGDSSEYYGYGYASPGKYYAGETLNPYAANNQSQADGTYYISNVSTNSGSAADAGKVYTQRYYDSQSQKSYKPYYYSLASSPDGSKNLGSEIDYINQNGTYKGFGADFFEANSNGTDRYEFTYSYKGDSSYYYGYGYANRGTYYEGETLNPYAANNQSQADGKYYIANVSKNSGSATEAGKVYTQGYYDSQSQQFYTPYYYNLASSPDGSKNLGSEIDYINQNGTYKGFGADFFEANSNGTDLYYFTYSYKGDSSKYYGFGYANRGTYYAGETLNPYAANNQSGADGTYYISSVSTNSGSATEAGKVYTYIYYDSQTQQSYTPYYYSLASVSPDGSKNLGSEIDYVNRNGIYTGFGADFFEAQYSG